MSPADLAGIIDAAWEARDAITPSTKGPVRESVEAALDGLDQGRLRVAEKVEGHWIVHQWLKKAVLLSFRLYDMAEIPGGPVDAARGPSIWRDKVPSKLAGRYAARFRGAGFRAVPSCAVRRSPYIASNDV